jgi:4-hydroxy-tetrahydrodipicolinate synthase
VIAGAGSNSTSQAIELSRDAESAGADAVLSVVPYYNKPTQAGMYGHFRAIAVATGLPVILHDVPARTVCGLADDTIARLAELPQFIGLRDASGDIARPLSLRSLVGSEFPIAVGRRCDGAGLLCARRGRLYFRHLERGAGPLPRNVSGVHAGPNCRRSSLQWRSRG